MEMKQHPIALWKFHEFNRGRRLLEVELENNRWWDHRWFSIVLEKQSMDYRWFKKKIKYINKKNAKNLYFEIKFFKFKFKILINK